jgi:hypothetical protein
MYFNRAATREVQSLLAQSENRERLITEEMVSSLPRVVQRWLKESNVIGARMPARIRIVQKGTLRTKPGGPWMPFDAVQHFTIDPPGFVWTARIHAAPLFDIAGRDKFQGGRGNMVIKPLYLFTAANSSGDEVDQGTLLRYLAEMAWFPQAAVSEYLVWEGVNANQARVTMTWAEVTASGIYSFDNDGRVTGFEAMRFGEFDGVFRKEKWSISSKGFKTFHNSSIGHLSEVTWKLKEGDFHWLNVEVTRIDPAQ